MPADIILTGTWLPSDSDTGSHRLLPFDVPAGTTRIDVRYSVEPLEGAARPQLDIGLFDPAGTSFLDPSGFRGWTGSFRPAFSVSGADSTPGYLRGPIFAGTWHLLIGADHAMLAPAGLRYFIEIGLQAQWSGRAASIPAEEWQPYEPYQPGVARTESAWYKGNLHSHTFYSDGRDSIDAMADEHLRLRLHFGALTEHNILNPDLAKGHRPDFIWLPSEEVTTYRGHLNAWGLSRWLDFRCTTDNDLQQVIDAAHAQGALTSVNHPKDDGPPWDYSIYAECMEVWQAPWFLGNYQSLALWDSLLRQGRQIVAVGGSDLHRISTPADPYPYNLDNPTTWVHAPDLSIHSILEGIRRGHVFISRDASGPQIHLTAENPSDPESLMAGDTVQLPPEGGLTVRARVTGGSGFLLRLVTQSGVVHTGPILTNDFDLDYLWTEAGAQASNTPTYIRAEVIRDMGPEVDVENDPSALWIEAMSNPIYAMRNT
ncbi:MAG: CehA/McbA family metallohydrolase [Chloroflexia bacterium]